MRLRRRKSPIWAPADDAPLWWFDAADEATLKGSGGAAIADNGAVYEFHNKGTVATKFVQHGSVSRPVWKTNQINGLPAVVFSGSHALGLDVKTGLASLPGLTVLMVVGSSDYDNAQQQFLHVRRSGDGSTVTMLDVGNGASARRVVRAVSGRLSSHWPGNEYLANAGEVGSNAAVHVFGFVFDYTNGKTWAYRDGVLITEGEHFSAGTSENANGQYVTLGADASSAGTLSQYMVGPVGEIIVWPHAKSPAAFVAPTHYARLKWGFG